LRHMRRHTIGAATRHEARRVIVLVGPNRIPISKPGACGIVNTAGGQARRMRVVVLLASSRSIFNFLKTDDLHGFVTSRQGYRADHGHHVLDF
jgi:hypothetical protein